MNRLEKEDEYKKIKKTWKKGNKQEAEENEEGMKEYYKEKGGRMRG